MTAHQLAEVLRGMAAALASEPLERHIPSYRFEDLAPRFLTEEEKGLFRIGFDFGEGMRKDLFTDNAPGLTITDYIDEAISQAECHLQSNPK